MSRWDRPPGPKDVRWFLRLVGKVLIVTGLLMFGFVAYQLWGTGIEYARAQDRAEERLQRAARAAVDHDVDDHLDDDRRRRTVDHDAPTRRHDRGRLRRSRPRSTTTSTTTTSTTPPATTIPDFGDDHRSGWRSPRAVRSASSGSRSSTRGCTSSPASVARTSRTAPATSRRRRCPVSSATRRSPATARPTASRSATSTSSRSATRSSSRCPYGIFTYRVTSVEIVDPSDREVIATTDPDVASLTLTTCHPEYSASQRLIIHADLDLEASPPPGLPVSTTGATRRSRPSRTAWRRRRAVTTRPTTTLAPTTTCGEPDLHDRRSDGRTVDVGGRTSLPPTTVVAPSTTTDPLYTVNPGGGAPAGRPTCSTTPRKRSATAGSATRRRFPR